MCFAHVLRVRARVCIACARVCVYCVCARVCVLRVHACVCIACARVVLVTDSHLGICSRLEGFPILIVLVGAIVFVYLILLVVCVRADNHDLRKLGVFFINDTPFATDCPRLGPGSVNPSINLCLADKLRQELLITSR